MYKLPLFAHRVEDSIRRHCFNQREEADRGGRLGLEDGVTALYLRKRDVCTNQFRLDEFAFRTPFHVEEWKSTQHSGREGSCQEKLQQNQVQQLVA